MSWVSAVDLYFDNLIVRLIKLGTFTNELQKSEHSYMGSFFGKPENFNFWIEFGLSWHSSSILPIANSFTKLPYADKTQDWNTVVDFSPKKRIQFEGRPLLWYKQQFIQFYSGR